jgi:protein-disulfide isomerase
MSTTSPRPVRRERRAAELAARRAAVRTPVQRQSPFGLVQITLIALVAGLVLIGAAIFLNRGPSVSTIDVVRASAPSGIPADGLVLGKADAPVTIEIYEDFQCPACLHWGRDVFPTLASHELADGTVKISFHGYAFIGPESIDAAKAAWAANQQGRFWDMWATLYANQGLHENAGGFARERLVAMADLIGLDHDRFLVDIDSAEAASAVSGSSASAVAAGINSTPSLVINGKLFDGAGYAELSTAIAAARG